MKLATLDLHSRAFSPGDVSSSLFGKAMAWIYLEPQEDSVEDLFVLTVRWSMADYLWCALAQAAREFGVSQPQPIGGEKGLRYRP